MECAHSLHHCGIDAFPRNLCKARIHDGVDVGRFQTPWRWYCGNKAAPLRPLAVVADGGGAPGVPCRPRRVGGRHQAPGINENLSADLLGQSLPLWRTLPDCGAGTPFFRLR